MDSKSVYIKGSPVNVDEASVRDAMKGHGEIATITIPDDRDFCFVEYETPEGAQAAVAAGTVTIADNAATIELRKGNRRGPRGANGGGRGSAPRVPEGTSHSIYIHSVDQNATREDIDAAFAPYGTIVRSQFRTSVNGRRYVFVEFETADVVAAVVSGGPFNMCGQSVEVEERHSVPRARAPREDGGHGGEGREGRESHARGGGGGIGTTAAPRGRLGTPPKPENSVYIKGFSPDTSEDTIRSLFAQYGEIKSIIVRVKHTEDDEIRTWAFVEYADSAAVEACVSSTASGLDIGGQQVVVEARKSEPKLFRRGGGLRGGGRGGHGGGRGRRRGPPKAHDGDEGH